jgi:NAD(P)-dependent dehydrogenase (short-subunit alcohol dehydrogenase family)
MHLPRLVARIAASLALAAPVLGWAGTVDPARPTVLITGSNRGIGLAFVRHYVSEGWNVLATARSPAEATELKHLAETYPHLLIEQLDVTDETRIGELAVAYRGTPVDLLINNAGVYGDPAAQTWGSLDAATFEEVMAVNVFAPLKMAEAFADHVAASRQKKIVALTSGVSSIELGRGASNGLVYAISKAALNMAMRKAGTALEDRGVIVALVAPGMVGTDMLALSRPGQQNALEPDESVASMARIIAALDASYDGRPITYDGEVLPW